MASVADVLRHLVAHAPGLSAEAREEFGAAVDADSHLAADHAAPAPDPAPEGGPGPDIPPA